MNREEIIDLAREYTVGGLEFDEEGLLRFVEIIAAEEREACAKVCESEIEKVKPAYSVTAENALKSIRARGQ